MTGKTIRSELQAEKELLAAAQWYEDRRAGLGDEFLDTITATLERVQENPEQYALVPDLPDELPARSAPVGRFPYSVIFIDHPEAIRILAFSHRRRRPLYWRDRA